MARKVTAVATRDALLDAAEELWSEYGLDGVSLRQIVARSGSSNVTAVHYHFGDRDGLLKALFDARLQVIERARAARLASLMASGDDIDLRAILDALFRPLAELRRPDGRRAHAALMLSLVTHNRGAVWLRFADQAPLAFELMGMARQHVPHLSESRFMTRVSLAAFLVWRGIVMMDSRDPLLGASIEEPDVLFGDLIDMACAVISHETGRAVTLDAS